MRLQTMAASVAALGVLAAAGMPALAQQFTMKISSPTTNDLSTEWMKAMKEGIEPRAGGKIKVEGYPANQLGQLPRAVEGVALGTIEVTISAVGFFVGLEPRFEAFEVPGLFTSIEQGIRVIQHPEVRKRWATFGETKGIEPLFFGIHAPLSVVTNKPVRNIADFKGMKIRTPGPTPIHMDPMRRLGIAPIGMALGEALPAMQNRTIDGVTANVIVFNTFKYYDIAKTATNVPGGYLVFAAMANRNWLKSLGPDLEKIVREEANKALALNGTYGIEDLNRAVKAWESNGGQVINLSEADQAKYIEEIRAAVTPILAKQPRVKEDYDAVLAVSRTVK